MKPTLFNYIYPCKQLVHQARQSVLYMARQLFLNEKAPWWLNLKFHIFNICSIGKFLLHHACSKYHPRPTSCSCTSRAVFPLLKGKAVFPLLKGNPRGEMNIHKINSGVLRQYRPDTSRRQRRRLGQRRRLPPCPLVTSLVPFKGSSTNLKCHHRVPLPRRKCLRALALSKTKHTGLYMGQLPSIASLRNYKFLLSSDPFAFVAWWCYAQFSLGKWISR